jgi:hypothetical protein
VSREPEDVVGWVLIVGLAMLALIGLSLLAWKGVTVRLDESSRTDCGRLGGRIEYSPPPHDSDWRCVGGGVEKVP